MCDNFPFFFSFFLSSLSRRISHRPSDGNDSQVARKYALVNAIKPIYKRDFMLFFFIAVRRQSCALLSFALIGLATFSKLLVYRAEREKKALIQFTVLLFIHVFLRFIWFRILIKLEKLPTSIYINFFTWKNWGKYECKCIYFDWHGTRSDGFLAMSFQSENQKWQRVSPACAVMTPIRIYVLIKTRQFINYANSHFSQGAFD